MNEASTPQRNTIFVEHLDGQQQSEHAVITRRQEPHVNRQQQEADGLCGDVAHPVHRQVAAESLQSVEHVLLVRRVRAGGGTSC